MTEPLHIFERNLCDHVVYQTNVIANSNGQFAAAIESTLDINCPIENGPGNLLSESRLRLIEGVAGLLRINDRLIPDVHVYDRWIDCLSQIVNGLGHQFAEEWRRFSLEKFDRLLLPRLKFADGVALIREWVVEAEYYVRAIGGRNCHSQVHPQIDDRRTLVAVAHSLQRIADHVDPPPPQLVGTRYVADKLGVTLQWVGQMIREEQIPRGCLVQATGNGRPWKLYRERIDAWLGDC